jgi:uncharacterized OB-fold protein
MADEKKYYLPEGLPTPRAQRTGLDTEFWAATKRHELVIQQCNNCKTFQWGPEFLCHKCRSFDMGWAKVSGRGRLYSWVRCWNPVHPALKEACPYIVAVIELPDGGNVRMVGNLLGDPMQNPPFDVAVEAVFEDHPDATLVQWKVTP